MLYLNKYFFAVFFLSAVLSGPESALARSEAPPAVRFVPVVPQVSSYRFVPQWQRVAAVSRALPYVPALRAAPSAPHPLKVPPTPSFYPDPQPVPAASPVMGAQRFSPTDWFVSRAQPAPHADMFTP